MSMLEVVDLHVAYGRVEAVRGVSLTLARGQIVTVIGANGAGKTTLLAALMGLLPSRGTMRFEGDDLAALDVEARVERGFGLVPEKRELFGDLSVLDNLILGAFVRRARGAALRHSLERVYARFPRLAERSKQRADTLSGGERQMLALGRALMSEPRLLMLDEPSLGLAPLVVQEILAIVRSLRAEGVSILLVEQNARAALEVADYAYVMELGAITTQGSPAEIAGDPRLVESYLGLGGNEY
jgi:branched-chain amino acid transport system ATP-binding protein